MSALEADIVIIGSGVAGAFSAWKLAQKGLKVLILEAGPEVKREEIVSAFADSPLFNLSANYPNPAYAPRPDWTQDDSYMRQTGRDITKSEYLRVLGGTTWHWSAATERFIPNDFRLKSTYGVGVDWPIGYSDMEPYYTEVEKEMGVSSSDESVKHSKPYPLPPVPLSTADQNIARHVQKLGLEVKPRPAARNTQAYDGRPRCEGFGTCTPICPIGATYNAMVHIEKARKLGVRVEAQCRVDRLETGQNGKIISAVFGRPDGSQGHATGKIFILAANALESPRLLLASTGESDPKGLANSSDQVGRNFMEHCGLQMAYRTPYPIYAGRGPVFTAMIDTYRDGSHRRDRGGFILSLDNRVDLSKITDDCLRKELQPPELDAAIRARAIRSAGFETLVEQLPDPENRVSIDWHDRDSAGQPRLVLHYSLGEYEKRGLKKISETCQAIAKAIDAEDVSEGNLISGHHMTGTLRMGSDAKTSVVDAFCRSHDYSNLFVAGSSVFPTSGTACPTLTLAALALRSAEAIAGQLTK